MLGTVAVVVMDASAAFELGLACEVFGIDRTGYGVPRFDFRVCAQHPGRLLGSTGVGLVAPYGLDAVVGADVVIVPAVSAPPESFPEPVLAALRAAARAGATLVSVCSGIFPLAEAGLLRGRRCTLHWRQVAAFAERYPDVELDPDVLYVDEGSVITSAGTAAGIDALLHLVRRELGAAVAGVIARHMVVAPQRDGGQRQFVAQPMPDEPCDSLQPVLDWMIGHLDAEFDVAALARLAAMSQRTFARRFVAETGTTPLRWLTAQRILRARHLLEESVLGVEDVARACGLGSGALLRHHFRRVVGLTPADYRKSFRVEPVRAG